MIFAKVKRVWDGNQNSRARGRATAGVQGSESSNNAPATTFALNLLFCQCHSANHQVASIASFLDGNSTTCLAGWWVPASPQIVPIPNCP